MGRIKYLKKIREFFRKTPVVNLSSLKKIAGKGNYVHLLVKNMVKRGEIKRITRGWYSIYDDPTLAVFCFKPAYLGLQEALSIHGLWEQETNAVILTSRNVRMGGRVIFGNNILIKKLKPQHFFGFEYKKYGDFFVPVSEIEKTFIDLIYFNQPWDKELMKKFRKRINRKKLKEYLQSYDAETAKKVKKIMRMRGTPTK